MSTQPILVVGPVAAELPPLSGAKAANLRRLSLHGFTVPPTLFLPPEAYAAFARHSDLVAAKTRLPAGHLAVRPCSPDEGSGFLPRRHARLRPGRARRHARPRCHHRTRVRHPLRTGVDEATARISDGQTVLVEGFRGEVRLDPQE